MKSEINLCKRVTKLALENIDYPVLLICGDDHESLVLALDVPNQQGAFPGISMEFPQQGIKYDWDIEYDWEIFKGSVTLRN